MRCGLMAVLVCWLTCATGLADWKTKTAEPGPTVWCRWAKPVTVDGRLDEWKPGEFGIVIDQAHMTGGNCANPAVVGGDADCSGSLAVKWDGSFLYLALRVRDDVLAPIDPEKGYGKPWEHDGLMFYLHAHEGLASSGRYGKEYRRVATDVGVLLGINYHQPQVKPRKLPGRSRYVIRKTQSGYVLEAGLDLNALGYRQPLPGDRLKMAMILVDRDPGQSAKDAFGQLVWQQGSPRVPTNPRNWRDLRLLRDGWGAELVGTVEGPPQARRLLLKGSLDARDRDLTFQGVRLTDAGGNVVKELKTSQRLAKGKRLSLLGEADVADLADGVYAVHAVVRAGGAEQVLGPVTQTEIVKHRVQVQAPAPVQTPLPVRYSLPANRHRPPTLKKINKDTYLEWIQEHARTDLTRLHGGPLKKAWKYAHNSGFLAAYLYAQTQDPFYAEVARAAWKSAVGWTKTQDKEGAVHVQLHYLMAKFMRESGLLTEKDEPAIREFLLTSSRRCCWAHYGWKADPWRRGAGHSSLGPAVGRYYAVHRYPDIPEAKLWTKYYNLTWGDWWEHRDTIYNDTGYRALFLKDVFLTAYLTGRDDLFTDKEAMKFWERLMWTTAPNGAHPHYGDTNGWSTELGFYAFYFEYIAAKTRDGRFKYAAHRIFDYIVNHCVDPHDYHVQFNEMLFGMTMAHMVADDSVQPKAPGRKSVFLTRKELVPITDEERRAGFGHQIYGFRNGPREIPDKIVFKSNDWDHALWAMIDVCTDAGHNTPAEPTNVAALMDQESVLTCNQGYFDETADLHNVVFAEDLEGLRMPSKMQMSVKVPEFYDRHNASYARVQVADYHGWPIDEERQFLFGRYRFLLLKDVVTFKQDWLCRIGPCWQTQQVGPEVGPNWANTYVRNLWLTGLGTGGGMHRWRQPAWDLLVFHPPQKDNRLEIVDRYKDQIWRVLPTRLRYAWRGMGRKGQQRHWTTLLLPHAPMRKPSELVDKIHVLADTLKLTALHVATDKYYEDWMVLNDTGGKVTVGTIQTDARQVQLWVRNDRHGTFQDGWVLAEGGTFIKFNGKELARVKKGQRIDKKF